MRTFFCGASAVAQTYRTATQSGVTPIAYHYELPVLTTDVDGLRTPVLEDDSGVVVQSNPEAIAKGIEAVLEPRRTAQCKANIQKAIPRYQWDTFAEQMTSFLES